MAHKTVSHKTVPHKTVLYKTAALFALLMAAFFFVTVPPAPAYTHKSSSVKFHEHGEGVIELARKEQKPVFMLFSAVWCYWCKVFEKETLTKKEVYSFLNENYISVFIDADLRRDLFSKYQVTFLPYAVFLRPDGTLLYKYGGTLDTEGFLSLIKDLKEKARTSEKIAELEEPFSYTPPAKPDAQEFAELKSLFIETAMENFDTEEMGIGYKRKHVLVAALDYLLENGGSEKGKAIKRHVMGTLEKAVDATLDPVEGGFFRYAEMRDWRIPHYEKMVDINGPMLYLLYKADSLTPSKKLKNAAAKTKAYLSEKLFDEKTGAFLSFQVADEEYYLLDAAGRKKAKAPEVIEKIFTDRLALALVYMLDALKFTKDEAFRQKVKSSVDFLAGMAQKQDRIYHLYEVKSRKWSHDGKSADYAYIYLMLSKAYSVFGDARYPAIMEKVYIDAKNLFYNAELGIFAEKAPSNVSDLEYIMEANSVFMQGLLGAFDGFDGETKLLKRELDSAGRIIAWFQGTGVILEERAWDDKDFLFLESYARYLKAAQTYFARVNRTVSP